MNEKLNAIVETCEPTNHIPSRLTLRTEERTMEPLDITRASPEELRRWLDQLPDGTTIIKESNSFDGAVTLMVEDRTARQVVGVA